MDHKKIRFLKIFLDNPAKLQYHIATMSTDESQPLLVPANCNRYLTIPHHDSNRSARRGLIGWMLGKWGKPEFKHHTTFQVIKHPGGEPLPHQPFLTKRNKYSPHVGKKQLAKLAR